MLLSIKCQLSAFPKRFSKVLVDLTQSKYMKCAKGKRSHTPLKHKAHEMLDHWNHDKHLFVMHHGTSV